MTGKNEIMFEVENKTNNLKQKVRLKKTNSTLLKGDAMEHLEKLKNKISLNFNRKGCQ